MENLSTDPIQSGDQAKLQQELRDIASRISHNNIVEKVDGKAVQVESGDTPDILASRSAMYSEQIDQLLDHANNELNASSPDSIPSVENIIDRAISAELQRVIEAKEAKNSASVDKSIKNIVLLETIKRAEKKEYGQVRNESVMQLIEAGLSEETVQALGDLEGFVYIKRGDITDQGWGGIIDYVLPTEAIALNNKDLLEITTGQNLEDKSPLSAEEKSEIIASFGPSDLAVLGAEAFNRGDYQLASSFALLALEEISTSYFQSAHLGSAPDIIKAYDILKSDELKSAGIDATEQLEKAMKQIMYARKPGQEQRYRQNSNLTNNLDISIASLVILDRIDVASQLISAADFSPNSPDNFEGTLRHHIDIARNYSEEIADTAKIDSSIAKLESVSIQKRAELHDFLSAHGISEFKISSVMESQVPDQILDMQDPKIWKDANEINESIFRDIFNKETETIKSLYIIKAFSEFGNHDDPEGLTERDLFAFRSVLLARAAEIIKHYDRDNDYSLEDRYKAIELFVKCYKNEIQNTQMGGWVQYASTEAMLKISQCPDPVAAIDLAIELHIKPEELLNNYDSKLLTTENIQRIIAVEKKFDFIRQDKKFDIKGVEDIDYLENLDIELIKIAYSKLEYYSMSQQVQPSLYFRLESDFFYNYLNNALANKNLETISQNIINAPEEYLDRITIISNVIKYTPINAFSSAEDMQYISGLDLDKLSSLDGIDKSYLGQYYRRELIDSLNQKQLEEKVDLMLSSPDEFYSGAQLIIERLGLQEIQEIASLAPENQSKIIELSTGSFAEFIKKDYPQRIKKEIFYFIYHSDNPTELTKDLLVAEGIFGDFISFENIKLISSVRTGVDVPENIADLGVNKTGEAGLNQLKAYLDKFKASIFQSGEIPSEDVIRNGFLNDYLRSITRADVAQWGSQVDIRSILTSSDRAKTQINPMFTVAEVKIDTLDQSAISEFEITQDALEQWQYYKQITEAALAIVPPEGNINWLALGELLKNIQVSVNERQEALSKGIDSLQIKIEKLNSEGKDTQKLQEKLDEQNANRGDLSLFDITNVEDLDITKLTSLITELSSHKSIEKSGLLQQLLISTALIKSRLNGDALPQIMQNLPDTPTLDHISAMTDIIGHIANQETWRELFTAIGGQKQLDNILSMDALISTLERSSEISSSGTRTFRFIPTRGPLMELSGQIGDACWASRAGMIAESHPNMTAVILVQNPENASRRLAGSFMLIETKSDSGEDLLVIRGLNPIENTITQLDVESFADEVFDYVKEIAERMGRRPAIVIDDHSGGSSTNRPVLFAHLYNVIRPTLENVRLESANDTTFNGYNITGNTFLLK